jgi:Rab proteins geranylgeranyltransferase component A
VQIVFTFIENITTMRDNVEEVTRDEEGLLHKYDVIICGTGLVQSIVASALTRAGKSVLHCDAQGYYGERDAVLSLPYLQQPNFWNDHAEKPPKIIDATEDIPVSKSFLTFHSTHTWNEEVVKIGTSVETPYGVGIVKELQDRTVLISLSSWVLTNGLSPSLYIGIPENLEMSMETYLATVCNIRPSILTRVHKLLQQNSRSFAIDLTPLLIFGFGPAVNGFIKSGASEYIDFKAIEGLLWFDEKGKLSRVPCSKGDVFSTNLLSPLEKRRFMKFLQLTMDYAIIEEAEVGDDSNVSQEIQSLNERQLNQGRSLSRPQNKAVKIDEIDVLKDLIDSKAIDFETYLMEKQKLTPSLTKLIRYALALETKKHSVPLDEGMSRLCQHLQALGKFGTTAFLAPMYGSGEFSQAFCRSAAVHGGTYLLRREPTSIKVVDGIATAVKFSSIDDDSLEKTIECGHIIAPIGGIGAKSSKRCHRRISVVSGKIVKESDVQRHIILIPPDSSLNNVNVIHGMVLDESLKVAPPNCTLVHLSTVVELDCTDALLDAALRALLSEDVQELYHVSFSYPIYDEICDTLPKGLHVAPQTGLTLAADNAFILAKDLFNKICPTIEFMALSEELDHMIKENLAGRYEEDDERDCLDKAAELVQSTKLNDNPEVS